MMTITKNYADGRQRTSTIPAQTFRSGIRMVDVIVLTSKDIDIVIPRGGSIELMYKGIEDTESESVTKANESMAMPLDIAKFVLEYKDSIYVMGIHKVPLRFSDLSATNALLCLIRWMAASRYPVLHSDGAVHNTYSHLNTEEQKNFNKSLDTRSE